MIISHEHRYVFLKPRKVGGTSLEIALSRHCGPADIITPISPEDEVRRQVPGCRSSQNSTRPLREWRMADLASVISNRSWPAKYYNHIPASAVRQALGEQRWEAYWRFSILRDPYERIVSAYFWRTRKKAQRPPFRDWLLSNPQFLTENMDITMEGGKPAVHHFIRFEDMPDNLEDVSRRTCGSDGLSEAMRTIHAKGGHRSKDVTAAMMFDGFSEGVRMVQTLCGPVLEMGGYASDPFS